MRTCGAQNPKSLIFYRSLRRRRIAFSIIFLSYHNELELSFCVILLTEINSTALITALNKPTAVA